MASEDEVSDGSLVLSSQETQFVPQEGDEEVLWNVIEITGETKKAYKVRWEGIDPETKKPWPQSWVLKHDCTDDIVVAWKLKKARKKRDAERKKAEQKSKGRASVAKRASKSLKSSTNSSSTVRGLSAHTTGTDATSLRGRVPAAKKSTPSRVSKASTSSKNAPVEIKRKRASDGPLDSEDDLPPAELAHLVQDEPVELHQRKKQKIDHNGKETVARDAEGDELSQDEENDELSDNERSPKVKAKRSPKQKRKPGTSNNTRDVVENNSFRPTIAMKTVRPGVGPNRNFLASAATRRKKRPQPKDEPSSDDEIAETKPISAAAKGKVLSELRANPLQKPSSSHRPPSPVLSPRAKTRLAEFDLDLKLVDEPLARGSLPPIAVLLQDSSGQSDHQGETNDHDHDIPIPSRSKPTSYRSGRSSKASKSLPSEEVPSSTLDLSIVPETEPESSCNSHARWKLMPDSYDRDQLSPPLRIPGTPTRIQAQTTTSTRSPLISRMKPNSPKYSTNHWQSSQPLQSPAFSRNESRHTNATAKSKPLQPVPVISPSVFHQISEAQPPDPSAPESRIESEHDFQKEAFTPSPIEHFSSPEKSTKSRLRNGERSRFSSKGSGADEAKRKRNAIDLAQDGVVDGASSKKTPEMKSSVKRPLAELLQAQKDLKFTSEGRTAKVMSTNEWPPSDMADASSAAAYLDGIEDQSTIQMIDGYVDLTAETGVDDSMTMEDTREQADILAHIHLRREEEESTQEAMMFTTDVTPLKMTIETESTNEPGSQIEGVHEVPSNVVEASPVTSPLPNGNSGQNAADTPGTGAHEINDMSGSRPILESGGNDPDTLRMMDSAIEAAREKQLAQIDSNDKLSGVHPDEPEGSGGADPIAVSAIAELQQQLAVLQATLDTEIRARNSAESDRDFFRDQYALASSYVSSVRAEKTELAERVEIAEKRAVDGVGLVRATFTERVRVLEAELTKARGEVRLLVERDRRTGNDIRRRAGEEPELRARCERLEQRVEQLEYEKEGLEMDLAELEAEKENWLNEVEVRNQLEVEEMDTGADAGAEGEVKRESEDQKAIVAKTETLDDGDEMVYRCQWRIDGAELCDWYSSDIEDLQRHLFLARHIQ